MVEISGLSEDLQLIAISLHFFMFDYFHIGWQSGGICHLWLFNEMVIITCLYNYFLCVLLLFLLCLVSS